VIAKGFVFVSGQTYVAGADIEAQTRGALDKIKGLLTEAGTDMAHAVRCTVFITDNSLRDRMNAVYATYFPKDPPARAVIRCASDPESKMLVEIDCTATLPE
jgi:2-iminobutanoate/2-iminopropanoate deaminase